MKRIVVTPHKIMGKCYFHRMGDRIVFIKGKDRMLCIDLEGSNCKRICMHGLSMLFPYVFAEKTWESKPGPEYYRCPDPGPECKGRGSVIFQLERLEEK